MALPTGVCWSLMYNASMDFDPVDAQIATTAVQDVRRLVEDMEKDSQIDKEFP
jgi:hypothetical protein